MMSTLSENIKKYRKLSNLTQKELAKKLNIAPTSVSAWEIGRNKPLMDNVEHMANIFNVTKSDLLGETLSEIYSQNSSISTIYDKLKPNRQDNVLSYAKNQLEEQEKEEVELFEVITTTKLAAGLGYVFNDYDQSKVYVDSQPPRYDVASFISGDSMEPDYHDGDIVYLVDTGFSTYNGEVCAVAVDDKTYLKRVYTEKDGLKLVSTNKNYEDIFITIPPSEGSHIKIYKVVGTDKVVEG